MKTEIYYFTGTGNSLVVARDIAAKTGGTLIPAASLREQKTIHTDAEAIGIIFPVYYGGMPIIIKSFAEKLVNIDSKYIFAVCTYGGGMGESLQTLNRILRSRSGKLAAGFGVHMPQNAFRKPWENPSKIFQKWPKKLEVIQQRILPRRPGMLCSDFLFYLMLWPFHQLVKPLFKKSFVKYSNASLDLSLEELIHLTDKSYSTSDQCTGCGICSQVCPVSNIQMVDQRPQWLNRCETCLACYNWCPNQAIHGGVGANGYYYRHPEVKISEIMNQKRFDFFTGHE